MSTERSPVLSFFYSIRHSLYGVAFGLLFPIFASGIEVVRLGKEFSFSELWISYGNIPLVIRLLAPVILGLFALWMSRAGARNVRQKQILIEARARHAEELAERNARLEAMNKTLEGLVYTASHELKTPVLNFKSMLNMLRTLKEEASDPKMEEEVLDRMEGITERFLQTIGDLMRVSESEASEEIKEEVILLETAIRNVLSGISETVREKQGKIIIETTDYPELKFSRVKLNNIFQNLILNALQFSHPERKPIITIQSAKEDGEVVIYVKDNGQGINLEKYGDQIFDMFTRFNADTTGNGVGLYIVKRNMEKAGGKVEIRSDEGMGTTVVLRFSARSKAFKDEKATAISEKEIS